MSWPLHHRLLLLAVVTALTATTEASLPGRPDRPWYGNVLPKPKGYVIPPDPPLRIKPGWPSAAMTRPPRDPAKLIVACWTYAAHPNTVADIKAFLRWGCQPTPHTCAYVSRLPDDCDRMYLIYPWVTARHVRRLHRRCRNNELPGLLHPGTHRPVSYCPDFIKYLRQKYGRHGSSRRTA